MPSLNNDQDKIVLSRGTKVIDQVEYASDWYGSDVKSKGGFSLERINPEDICGIENNWTGSEHPDGGTPGQENSILDSAGSTIVDIRDIRFTSLNELLVVFSHRLDTSASIALSLDNETANYAFASESSIAITSADSFARGRSYTVSLDSLASCQNARAYDLSASAYLHDSGDVVINELLFNPRGSGTDFVELLNNSDAVINLRDWTLGYYDSNDSLRHNIIASSSIFISTDEHLCLHEDKNDILENYPQAFENNLLAVNLPPLPNDTGDVWLFDQFTDLMGQVHYSEEMHFPLIKDLDGVTLERMSPEVRGTDRSNWHSASADENYATPGYLNSQFYPESMTGTGWSLSDEYISPDNDGYQDVVRIEYLLSVAGSSATIRVYNDKGVLIKSLVSNALLGSSGSFVWDGTSDSGEKARTGIHVIMVEAFDLAGSLSRKRLPVIVATRLR
ncbi:MAG: hypothetical protein HOG66_08855 [Flavobacteriales bacterium]|nr:hypothetical protein [Flavobacteriales bacterium]